MLRTAALVIAMYLAVMLVWHAHPLVFATFLGILFGLGLSAGVDRLERLRVPRVIGTPLIVLGFFGILTGVGFWLAPTIREQATELRQQLPAAIDRLEAWIGQRPLLLRPFLGENAERPAPQEPRVDTVTAPVAARAPQEAEAQGEGNAFSLRERMGEQLSGAVGYLFPLVGSTMLALAGVLYVLFLAIYLAVDPDVYHRGLMALFPRKNRERAGEVLSAMASKLRRWLLTQLGAMLAVGVLTSVTLLFLDIPGAVALGVLAGLLEFIPTVGPLIASIPAVAMGFLASPQQALIVAIAYIVIQQVESQIVTPVLMKEGIDLPPVLTIATQAIMALLFGFLGLLVAVPMAAAGIVAVRMLYVEDVLNGESRGAEAGSGEQ